MKKITAILLIVLALIPSLAFAGGSKEEASAETSGKTVVRLWTNDRHDAAFWTEKGPFAVCSG